MSKKDVKSTQWERLKPFDPYYFFVRRDFSHQARYDKFWSTKEIFIQSSSGVKTHRDHFVIGFTEKEIKQRMITFVSNLPDDLVARALHLKDTRDWKLKTARQSVKTIEWTQYIRPYLYRPFDIRNICYLKNLIELDRRNIMTNFLSGENYGLIVTRTNRQISLNYFFVSLWIADTHILDNSRDATCIFPLYVYPEDKQKEKRPSVRNLMLFEPKADYWTRKPNLSATIIEQLTKNFKKASSSEQIFFYIYAVLYSNTYRTKYAEFLKIDFPRIPFTKDYKLFGNMADYGKMLVDLHLLKSPELDPPIARFQGKGDNTIEKLRYEPTRLFINGNQYFEGIVPEVFGYQIGGYQVCEKWLKDRKGKKPSLDEIKHYCNIITAIKKTLEIQKSIDDFYLKIEDETI